MEGIEESRMDGEGREDLFPVATCCLIRFSKEDGMVESRTFGLKLGSTVTKCLSAKAYRASNLFFLMSCIF